jgi:deoxycytidine triphosphate deaminase
MSGTDRRYFIALIKLIRQATQKCSAASEDWNRRNDEFNNWYKRQFPARMMHVSERAEWIPEDPVHDTELYEFPGQSGVWQLEAGRHTLACTAEYIGITSSLAGRVDGKSSWARKGLLVHTAGFIDPGFRGQITLELKNLGHKPIMLRRLNPICQVSFDWLDAPARRPYGHPGLKSHYQGQTGITHYGGPQ